MTTTAELILKRDRLIVMAGLAAVTVLAWGYLRHLASGMADIAPRGAGGMDMSGMDLSMATMHAWGTGDILLTFLMWAVMMVAMMTPSVTPMMLTFAKVTRRRPTAQPAIPATMVFLFGYLIMWTAFSAIATLVQWGLHAAALLSPQLIRVSPLYGGMLLLLAGLYQFTALKDACLSHCRTPLGFLMAEWRDGAIGALVMGVRHGVYCVGCCWLLMGLLFVAGMMNLLWVALIAGYVLGEKVLPAGHWGGRATGLLIVGWGAWVLIRVVGVP